MQDSIETFVYYRNTSTDDRSQDSFTLIPFSITSQFIQQLVNISQADFHYSRVPLVTECLDTCRQNSSSVNTTCHVVIARKYPHDEPQIGETIDQYECSFYNTQLNIDYDPQQVDKYESMIITKSTRSTKPIRMFELLTNKNISSVQFVHQLFERIEHEETNKFIHQILSHHAPMKTVNFVMPEPKNKTSQDYYGTLRERLTSMFGLAGDVPVQNRSDVDELCMSQCWQYNQKALLTSKQSTKQGCQLATLQPVSIHNGRVVNVSTPGPSELLITMVPLHSTTANSTDSNCRFVHSVI